MKQLRLVGLIALALLAASPAISNPARADAILDTVRNLTLLGTWADDCSKPHSTSNWYITYYAAANGTVRRIGQRGSENPTLDGTVDRAERLTATTARMNLRNDDPNWGDSNGRAYDVIVEVTGNTSRSLSSIGSDGVQYITEGKFRDGKPVPILKRCRTQPIS